MTIGTGRRGWTLVTLLCLAWMVTPAAVLAADYPAKTVRIVVPYPPGGPADAFARIVAPHLAAAWKQPVVVENRAGATGIIGTDAVAKAPPDGHTLLVGSGSTAIGVTLEDKLPYDTMRDLLPVSGLASTPYFLFANASFPADSIRELIALARAKPEQVAFASSGTGGAPHLSGEMFNLFADTKLLHVPYKGTAPATTAMVGGEVQLMFGSLAATNTYVKAKRLKVLGAADARRSAFLPDVPTIAEAGVPGYEAENWFGLFAPAGTPPETALRISDAVAAAMAVAEVREQLWTLGAVPMQVGAREFPAYFRRQVDLWAKVIRGRGLKVN